MDKKRVIKSLDKLSDELKIKLKKQYPDGFDGYLVRLTNAQNQPIFCVPLDTDDTNYLVKIAVSKNSDGGYDIEEDDDDFADNEDMGLDEDFDEDFDD